VNANLKSTPLDLITLIVCGSGVNGQGRMLYIYEKWLHVEHLDRCGVFVMRLAASYLLFII
jgi:hypothetical protein